MKCPNCGNEIEDGKLLCEICATEIQFVPEFEPEIENKINESLSDVASLMDDTSVYESPLTKNYIRNNLYDENAITKNVVVKNSRFEEEILNNDNEDNNSYNDDADDLDDINIKEDDLPDDQFWDVEEVLKFSKNHNLFKKLKNNSITKTVVVICISCLLIIIILVCCMMINSTRSKSYEHLTKQANACIESKDYLNAIDYLEDACLLKESTTQDYIKLADIYIQAEMPQNAEAIYNNLIMNSPEDFYLYELLFKSYEKQGKTDKIIETITTKDNEDFSNHFNQYLALPPVFSEQPGTFDEVIYLKISANTSGHIYYTVDGSTPDTTCWEYTAPIFLEAGDYCIKALFINDYGYESEVSTANYTIKVATPEEPVISLESGSYTDGAVISVDNIDEYENCNIYYTLDGTTPTDDSILYSKPICLPLGESHFSFIAINDEELTSKVITKNYTLTFTAPVTPDDAVSSIFGYCYNKGIILDYEGSSADGSGRYYYSCDAGVKLGNTNYFVVSEYFEDGISGLSGKTGLHYLVNCGNKDDYGILEIDEHNQPYLKKE